MGIFSKPKCYFEGADLSHKTVKNCLKRVPDLKKIKISDVRALLCTPSKEEKSFLLCTKDALLYANKKGILVFTVEAYPLSAIVGITSQSKSLLNYVVINLGGAQTIVTDVWADMDDFMPFANKVMSLKDAPRVGSITHFARLNTNPEYTRDDDSGNLGNTPNFCPNCGAKVRSGSKFCGECGYKF